MAQCIDVYVVVAAPLYEKRKAVVTGSEEAPPTLEEDETKPGKHSYCSRTDAVHALLPVLHSVAMGFC